jgi:2-oxoglutarate ferredoxin oxidoreductase subunit delta
MARNLQGVRGQISVFTGESGMDLCQIDEARCKGCELCVAFCPKGALVMADHRNASGFHPAVLKHPELCTGCAMCAQMCPEAGINIYRRQKRRAREETVNQG